MADLSAFLRDALARHEPWNCSTLPADWAIANGHPDFAEAWRDTTDPHECERAAKDGLLALWEQDIADALTVGSPCRGSIAVVKAMGLEAGAIFTGERWAIQGPRTLHFLAPEQVRVLKAWSV